MPRLAQKQAVPPVCARQAGHRDKAAACPSVSAAATRERVGFPQPLHTEKRMPHTLPF